MPFMSVTPVLIKSVKRSSKNTEIRQYRYFRMETIVLPLLITIRHVYNSDSLDELKA